MKVTRWTWKSVGKWPQKSAMGEGHGLFSELEKLWLEFSFQAGTGVRNTDCEVVVQPAWFIFRIIPPSHIVTHPLLIPFKWGFRSSSAHAWAPSYLLIEKDLRLLPTKRASAAIRFVFVKECNILNRHYSFMGLLTIFVRRRNKHLWTYIQITGDWRAVLMRSPG